MRLAVEQRNRTARLLLELKARLDLPSWDGGGSMSPGPGSPKGEARAALVELGYGPDEIAGALDGIDGGVPVEEMVRTALRELVRSR